MCFERAVGEERKLLMDAIKELDRSSVERRELAEG